MTEPSAGRGPLDDSAQATHVVPEQAQHVAREAREAREARSGEPSPSVLDGTGLVVALPRQAGQIYDSKSFLKALFDFDFTYFITPKAVRILYILAMIGAALSGLGVALFIMLFSRPLGVLALIIWTPLSFIITMALTRVTLEYFVVNFRVAEDLRALRALRDRAG